MEFRVWGLIRVQGLRSLGFSFLGVQGLGFREFRV